MKKSKRFILSAYLKNAIRRLSYRFSSRAQAIAAVRLPRPAGWPNKRIKWVVPCATCGGLFEIADTQCDHIQPVIPVSGWPPPPVSTLYEYATDDKDMNVLIYRTFVSPTKLQVLCRPCHKTKTDLENIERRKGAL